MDTRPVVSETPRRRLWVDQSMHSNENAFAGGTSKLDLPGRAILLNWMLDKSAAAVDVYLWWLVDVDTATATT